MTGHFEATGLLCLDVWEGIGEVVANEWLATLALGERELIVFGDGRCLVKGTADVAEAQVLRERYLRGD